MSLRKMTKNEVLDTISWISLFGMLATFLCAACADAFDNGPFKMSVHVMFAVFLTLCVISLGASLLDYVAKKRRNKRSS